MGLLTSLGKYVISDMEKKMERMEYYKEKYDRLDDKELYRKMQSSSGDAKLACAALLKERGYGRQE